MAPTSITSVTLFSLLVLLAIPTLSLAGKPLKQTNMVFYMHDYQTATKGQNATCIAVAGNPKLKGKWGPLDFGTVYVIDDALTETVDRSSPEIGRAHGIYINSALDGSDLHFAFSLIFSNAAYNGSTFEIRGADRFFLKAREVSVVSGTKQFRLAKGYAVLETAFLDVPKSNAIVKFNLTAYHPW